jgi:signal transduction histidine kinase
MNRRLALPRCPVWRLRTQLLAAFAVVAVVALAAGGAAVVRLLLDYRTQATTQRLYDAALSAGAAGAMLERQGNAPATVAAGIASQVPLSGARVLTLDAAGNVLADWTSGGPTPEGESLAGQQLQVPGAVKATGPQLGLRSPFGTGGAAAGQDGRVSIWRGDPAARGAAGYLFVAAATPPQNGPFSGGQGRPREGGPYQQAPPAQVVDRVVLAVPQGSLPSAWEELAPGLAGAAAVALLAAAAAAWALAGSVAGPLRAVTRATARVARGEPPRPVPEAGAAEVAQLARAFNAMAQEVARSQETLRAFVADASHELRTPLTAIQGFSQAVADGVLEAPAPTRAAAGHLHREAARMRRLVEDLLLLSKMEARDAAPPPGEVDVADLLDVLAQRLRPAAARRGLRLTLALPPRLAVPGAPAQLERLFGNLLENAAKYAPAGGAIAVRAAPGPGGTATVAVHNTADAASAIPPAALPHLFERFYRVDKSRARGAGEVAGSGLGLAIAREAAERHGGAIAVASDPAAGTTFTVTLPALPPSPPATAPPAAERGAPVGGAV